MCVSVGVGGPTCVVWVSSVLGVGACICGCSLLGRSSRPCCCRVSAPGDASGARRTIAPSGRSPVRAA